MPAVVDPEQVSLIFVSNKYSFRYSLCGYWPVARLRSKCLWIVSILFRVLQISKIISLVVIKAKCFWQIQTEAYRSSYWTEAYSEPGQTYKMKLYIKIVNDFPPWTIFVKGSILDVWLDSEYASVGICYSCLIIILKYFIISYFVNHFMPLVSFDTSWKHQKTFGLVSWCFQGVSKETSALKWVKEYCHSKSLRR